MSLTVEHLHTTAHTKFVIRKKKNKKIIKQFFEYKTFTQKQHLLIVIVCDVNISTSVHCHVEREIEGIIERKKTGSVNV